MHKKLTKDQKQSTKQRIITGLIMAFYGVIIFIFFAFADPGIHIDIHNNEFMRFDQSRSWTPFLNSGHVPWKHGIFGALSVIIVTPILYFISKELCNCFFKKKNNKIIWYLTVSLSLIQLIPTLMWMIPTYFHISIGQDNAYSNGIWLSLFLCTGFFLVIVCLPVNISLIRQSKTSLFNMVVFPLLCVVVPISFGCVYYLAIVRSWSTLFLLLVCIVLCDIFAFVIGILFGNHKMSPKISPKKSWEGTIGGVIIGSGVFIIIIYLFTLKSKFDFPYYFFGCQFPSTVDSFYTSNPGWWVTLAIVGVILSIGSVLGDLFFSWIKRKNNIKDFANSLPGHGGFLDRMDSMISVTIWFGIITFCIGLISCFINKGLPDGQWIQYVFPTFLGW